jgi:transcriptional regulator with XRE-family HTH domain
VRQLAARVGHAWSNEPVEPRDELAQFLRTRRASLKPEAVGLPTAGRRRTPGLRREEVALLAGVSVSWYTWLEQGRPIRASHEVLIAIARTLQLTPTERAHLLALADRADPVATPESDRAPDQLVRLIEAMAPSPAYVLGPRWEFLAWNRAQALLFPAIERLALPERNLLWVVFATAEGRSLIVDWPIESQRMLTQFRADTDRLHDDAALQELIARLTRASPDFAEGWARHDVTPFESRVRRYAHPRAGTLVFEYQLLVPAEFSRLRVVVQLPVAGDDSTQRLAAWHHVV